jgi:polysaccharide export outer membrane protein
MRCFVTWICLLGTLLLAAGCRTSLPHHKTLPPEFIPPADMPRELSKTVLPTYTIEPPDILVIEAIHVVPRPPYHLRTGDVVSLNVTGTVEGTPLMGTVAIPPGGIIALGPTYGAAKVTGLTIEQAEEEVRRVIAMQAANPVVSLSLVEMSGQQQIAGQHLVGLDGTVTLGSYGSVPVVGLSLAQAKHVIEQHLAQFLEDPEVAVDVFAYNSKVYYVFTEGAGLGDTVTKFPVTGNETVLDAIANVNGLSQVSSKRIWIARPVPHSEQMQILPVDWKAVTAGAVAATNYQIMPGDRVFVAEDRLVALDTNLAKIFAPFERMMGFSLLGVNTATRFSGPVLQGGGDQRSGFGGGF